ncbi:MAG: hypothetical protein KAR47_19820, partial [Planctomycetes bacterium]|nr:hypothetical protein [Planctomycetota bacterium]
MRGKVLIALAFFFCLAGLVFAADRPGPPTFRLVPQDYTTIQAAIDAAIDDDVVMLSPGVYSGAGNRDLDFGGKAITVRSAGDPASCIIDCEGLGRGFIFQNDEGPDSAIEGLTIMGGYHDSFGGGIECEYASPTIFNCMIIDCTSFDGGGIDCYGASPLIRDCIISGNSAVNDGGGIEFYESLDNAGLWPEVINCLIESNSAGNNGGAISSYSSAPRILNCTFIDNYSTYGSGGIYAVGNSFAVRNCILWDRDGTTEIIGCSAEYSCIKGGQSGINGNTAADPLFRTGPLGDYYLSQTDAGQLVNSPCFDAGDPFWALVDMGLDEYSTATDNVADIDIADMGYHYPGGADPVYYELDASVVGLPANGLLQVNPNEVFHREFSEVRLTAVPDYAHKVTQWTGTDNDSSVSNDNVVLMTSDRAVTVEFDARQSYQLTTMAVGGNGTITPPSGMYFDGELVPLIAEPASGFRVKEWTGTDDDFSIDPNNYVVMNSDKTVTVEFIDMSKSVYLTARVVGGHGTIVPWRGVYELTEGVPPTTVLLQATPDYGFKLKQWTGTSNDSSNGLNNVVTMTEDRYVTVEFEGSLQVYLTVDIDQPGEAPPEYGWVEDIYGNRVNGGMWVYENEVVQLTAVVSNPSLYDIRGWFNVDWSPDLTAPVQTVTMSEGGKYVRALFKQKSQSPAGPVWIVGSTANYNTIQRALNAASAGDVVRVADGIYSGNGNYDLDFGGKGITLESEYGPEYCIIDPQWQGRAITFNGGETGYTLVDGFTIQNGRAGRGGGISCLTSGPSINNCIITNCEATGSNGGGIFIMGTNEIDPDIEWEPWDPNTISWPKISNCKITNNTAADDGGGIACRDASPMIMGTEISSNTANGIGGGIYCDNASNAEIINASNAEIINCLVTENVSRQMGAGIHFQNSFGMVHLSTIANNNSLASNDRGGITVRLQNMQAGGNQVVISNSVIWGNGDDLWQSTGGLIEVNYSCIEDDNGIGSNQTGNIDQDPLFVTGPLSSSLLGYYLPFDSPCIDAGEETLVFRNFVYDYNLSGINAPYQTITSITTDVGNDTDYSEINMGFHYPKFYGVIKPVLRKLEIRVNNDFGSVGFGLNGSTGPHYGYAAFQQSIVYYFVDGTTVDLQAIPIPGYRVQSWQGADDDWQGFNQLGVFNTVTLQGGDRWVTVTFEPKFTTIWHVPGDFPYIQDAIDAAKDGDTVMVHPATYIGVGFVVLGKDITITSENPTDPDIVAATIIDCTDQLNQGFVLMGTGFGSCTLNGFTIINAVYGGGQNSSPSSNAPGGTDGTDAFFTFEGGGIASYGDHIIANCVLRGCRIIGHGGADGKNGATGSGDMADGGHGGGGSDAAGGGIYIGSGSAQVLNCTIEGCEVTGGLGGLGANGASGNQARWISQGGYGGFAGKAYGGGIYVNGNGVIIRDCTIRDCRVIGAQGGDGGNGGALSSGGNGGVPGGAFGAGIYIADWASADVKGTVVENCEVIGGLGGNGGDR